VAVVLANYAFTNNLWSFLNKASGRIGDAKESLAFSLSTGPDVDGDQQLVDIVNELHNAVLDEVPALSLKETDVQVAAGQTNYPIPEDLFRSAIISIFVSGTNDVMAGADLRYLTPQAWRTMGPGMLNGYASFTYPPAYTVSDDQTEFIMLLPYQAFQVTVRYRYKPHLFTVAEMDDPDSEEFFSIPDEFIDVLVLRMAQRMAQTKKDWDSADRLEAEYEKKLRVMQQRLAFVDASNNSAVLTYGGGPNVANYPSRFGNRGSAFRRW